MQEREDEGKENEQGGKGEIFFLIFFFFKAGLFWALVQILNMRLLECDSPRIGAS